MANFQDQMAEGKARAHERRQRGLPDGTSSAAGWDYQRAVTLGIDAIEAYYLQWRKDVSTNAYSAVEYALFQDDYDELARIAEWEFGR